MLRLFRPAQFLIVTASLLGGCAGLPQLQPPTIEPPTSAAASGPEQKSGSSALTGGGMVAKAPPVAAPRPAATEPTRVAKATTANGGCAACTIIGFRSPIVTLFMSERGQDGQRVPRETLAVPMHGQAIGGGRLQIMTLDGPRWVAQADVDVSPPR